MKNKYGFVFLMLICMFIGCVGLTGWYVKNQEVSDRSDSRMRVVTSFYPMYIAAKNVIGDTEGIVLENLSEPQTGCLHDFQLTPEDMKLLSTADLFVVNGGGIESFLTDVASDYPKLRIVQACEDVQLISNFGAEEEHDHETEEDHDHEAEEGHDHDHGESNAHAWMSLDDYQTQVQTIAEHLMEMDGDHAEQYRANAEAYVEKLCALSEEYETLTEALGGKKVILLSEAFAYVARDYGMEVVNVLDMDEDRQVSAGELQKILTTIEEQGASCILAEERYGKRIAQTIQGETEISVFYLDPLTRGEYDADSYLNGMRENLRILGEGL